MCLRKAALRSLIILSLMPTAIMSAFADDAQSLLQKGFSARDVWSVEPQLMLKANVKFVNLKSGDIEATYTDVTANQKHRREFSSDVYSEKSGSNETAFWYLHSSPEKPLQVLGLESALAELHNSHKEPADQVVAKKPEPRTVDISRERKQYLAQLGLKAENLLLIEEPRHQWYQDKESAQLLLVVDGPWIYQYSDYAPYKGKTFPQHVKIFMGTDEVAEISLELTAVETNAGTFVAPTGAVSTDRTCGIRPPRLVRSLRPSYPPIARQLHITGQVVIFAIIGEDGLVHSTYVLSSPSPYLAEPALLTVRDWKYEPGTVCNKPVQVQENITVNFHLP